MTEADGRGHPAHRVDIRLLGGFHVAIDGRDVTESTWRLRKAQSLVKLLALNPAHQLHAEQVIDTLWPEFLPDAASNNLRQVIHAARQAFRPPSSSLALAPSPLQVSREVISFDPSYALTVDVESFECAARHARVSGALAAYQAAIDCYTGDLLPEDRYEPWVMSRGQVIRNTYHDLMLELARLYEGHGDTGLAIDTLQRVLASDPIHEDACAALMQLYATIGLRHQAISQYRELQVRLREAYGTEPDPATTDLYRRIVNRSPRAFAPQSVFEIQRRTEPRGETSVGVADSIPSNLPAQLTSLVSRERELWEIEQHLAVSRLVTLTGPGGIGKTRLVLEVARRVLHRFPDGVYLVLLAPVRHWEHVVPSIASVLDVRESSDRPLLDLVTERVRDKRLLLVFDNVEHVPQAGVVVSRLLARCPGLSVLMTSRMRLRLHGEQEYPVPPLPLPDEGSCPPADELAEYAAPKLFIQRAKAITPNFRVTRSNAPAIVEVCRRLDGLPLAIELAAARSKILTPQAILDRLDDPLTLLRDGPRDLPERQQTIRDTIAWSYDLLTAEEQGIFRRLGVFVGGWTLEAAEAIGRGTGSAELQILDGLASLADQSLIRWTEVAGEPRFSMLETIREFALERLEESGEAESAHRAHLDVLIALAEHAEPALFGPDEAAWLERLEQEYSNLRVALEWCGEQSNRAQLGLQLASSLWLFWDMRAHLSEGRQWLDRLLRIAPQEDTRVRAWALFAAGYLATRQGDAQSAREFLDQALVIFREFADLSGVARTLGMLGAITSFEGEYEKSAALMEEALTAFRASGDQLSIARTLLDLGDQKRIEGDYHRARELLEESYALFNKCGFHRGMAWALANLGNTERADGDYEDARRHFNESRAMFESVGDKRGLARPILYLANLARIDGDSKRASLLFQDSLALLLELEDRWRLPVWLYYVGLFAGQRREYARCVQLIAVATVSHERFERLLDPAERAEGDVFLDRGRAAIGADAFARAWADGQHLTLEQAVSQSGLTLMDSGRGPTTASRSAIDPIAPGS